MGKIITALRSLNIEAKLITDIDILNDETVFKGTAESCGVEFSSIQSDYNNIVSNLHSLRENVNRNTAKTIINQILDGSNNVNLSNREVKDIREAISTTSK